MPSELQEIFRPYALKPEVYEIQPVTKLPFDHKLVTRQAEAIQELHDLLHLLAGASLKISNKTLLPSAGTIKTINQIFTQRDYYQNIVLSTDQIGDIKAVGWVMLLQAGRLIKRTGTNIDLTAKGKKALSMSPKDVLKELWEAWIDYRFMDEFKRIHNIKGQGVRSIRKDYTNPCDRRKTIHSMLTSLPANEWLSINEISRYIILNNYDYKITHSAPYGLYVSDPSIGSLGLAVDNWHLIAEPYLLCVLLEYAATIGMIDVAHVEPLNHRMHYYTSEYRTYDDIEFISRYDGLTHIKITELGQYILGNMLEVELKTNTAKISVSKEGLIDTNGAWLDLKDVEVLNTFAAKQDKQHWQLNKENISQAIYSGQKITTLTNFFKSKNIKLQNELQQMIDTINKNNSRIKYKETVLIYECENESFADELMSGKAGAYALRAGSTLVAIPEKHQQIFQRLLSTYNIMI